MSAEQAINLRFALRRPPRKANVLLVRRWLNVTVQIKTFRRFRKSPIKFICPGNKMSAQVFAAH